MIRSEHKIALICLKYIPVIMFLLMWIYTIFALFGINLWIADTIVGCAILPSILIFSLSQVFHFCVLHKSLTGFSLTVDILINIDKYFGFGTVLFPIQLGVGLVGLILFIMLLWKVDRFRNKCIYLDLFIAQEKGQKFNL